MSDQKSKEVDIIVKEIAFAGDIKIKWEQFNANIEAYEPSSRDFKEQPAESFFDSAKDVVQQAAQALGYPNKHEAWGKYKPKKIKLDGLKVSVEFIHFTRKASKPIETKLPQTNEVVAEVIQDLIDEVRNFINGAKGSRQGDLFHNEMHDPDIKIADAEIIEEEEEPLDESKQLSKTNVDEEGLVKA